jgi:hypothetical protein
MSWLIDTPMVGVCGTNFFWRKYSTIVLLPALESPKTNTPIFFVDIDDPFKREAAEPY